MTTSDGDLTESDLRAVGSHIDEMGLRGHSDTTIYGRFRALVRFSRGLPPGVTVLTATADDLYAWRVALRLSDDTTAREVGDVKLFYRWAARRGLVTSDPAADLPVPRTSRRLPRPIDEDELDAAVASAPPRIRPWLVLAGWAGLRAKEIAYLRRENVLDTAPEPLIVIAAGATKGRGERVVPMSAYVLGELRAAGIPARGYVFGRRDGRPGPNAPWMVSRLCNLHLHACGVDASLHQLRHRFGTQTYRQSHDLRLTQELLGHVSPSTTAGYAAYDRDGAADVVNALPAPRRLRAAKLKCPAPAAVTLRRGLVTT